MSREYNPEELFVHVKDGLHTFDDYFMPLGVPIDKDVVVCDSVKKKFTSALDEIIEERLNMTDSLEGVSFNIEVKKITKEQHDDIAWGWGDL